MDLNEQLVSVVVPCYNAEKYIQSTVKSVLNQTYKNIEIIIVNDGSIDGSEAIIKGFFDERILYISLEHRGVSAARNYGLDLSKGKYILFLDADDILQSGFIRKRVEFLKLHQHYAFCASRVTKIDKDGIIIKGNFTGPSGNLVEDILLYNQDVVTCPSLFLIRSEVLKDNKVRFNSRLFNSADRFFLLQLWAGKNSCCLIDDDTNAILFYRSHTASMSNNFNAKLIKDLSLYMYEVGALPFIAPSLMLRFLRKHYYIITMSYYKLGMIGEALLSSFSFILVYTRYCLTKRISWDCLLCKVGLQV